MKITEIDSKRSPPNHMIDAWTDTLRHMGTDTVRIRLCGSEVSTGGPNAPVKFARVLIDGKPYVPERQFVEAWLALEDRKSRRRASIQNALVWVGAISAVVGATTGLMSVFGLNL